MAGRRRSGTNIRRQPDILALGEGLKRPGIDTRTWVSHGTVASVRGEEGQPNFEDENAVFISDKGVEVDVILEPDNVPTTCTYGLQAGDCWIVAPIHPGDLVTVIIPKGEYGAIPRIVAVGAGPHTPMPLEDDRKPVFRNDRLHIFAKTVPIEIRTAGGARVVLDQDGQVQVVGQTFLGAADAEQRALLGDNYRSAEALLNDAVVGLQFIWNGAAGVCVGPLTPLKPFFLGAVEAIKAFEKQASQFLSNTVRVKE